MQAIHKEEKMTTIERLSAEHPTTQSRVTNAAELEALIARVKAAQQKYGGFTQKQPEYSRFVCLQSTLRVLQWCLLEIPNRRKRLQDLVRSGSNQQTLPCPRIHLSIVRHLRDMQHLKTC